MLATWMESAPCRRRYLVAQGIASEWAQTAGLVVGAVVVVFLGYLTPAYVQAAAAQHRELPQVILQLEALGLLLRRLDLAAILVALLVVGLVFEGLRGLGRGDAVEGLWMRLAARVPRFGPALVWGWTGELAEALARQSAGGRGLGSRVEVTGCALSPGPRRVAAALAGHPDADPLLARRAAPLLAVLEAPGNASRPLVEFAGLAHRQAISGLERATTSLLLGFLGLTLCGTLTYGWLLGLPLRCLCNHIP